MKIFIVSAVGRGQTLLSAFDNALINAGIANYNLIVLSSIIPPGAKVVKVKHYSRTREEFGFRLYVVHAELRSNEVGKFIATGLGWYQSSDGRGFFVEHAIKGETKTAAEGEIGLRIYTSLKDMCRFRRIKFVAKKINSVISIGQIKDSPTSVLAAAVYQSEGWRK